MSLLTQRTTQYYHPKKEAVAKKDVKIAGFFTGEGEEEEGAEQEEVDSFDTFNFWRQPIEDVDIDLDLLAGDQEDYNSVDDFGYDSDKENGVSEDGDSDEDGDDEDEDDEDGWITPGNVKDKKKQFNGEVGGELDAKVSDWSKVPPNRPPGAGGLHDDRLRDAERPEAARPQSPRH
jgi:hypothetical protein